MDTVDSIDPEQDSSAETLEFTLSVTTTCRKLARDLLKYRSRPKAILDALRKYIPHIDGTQVEIPHQHPRIKATCIRHFPPYGSHRVTTTRVMDTLELIKEYPSDDDSDDEDDSEDEDIPHFAIRFRGIKIPRQVWDEVTTMMALL